MAYESLTLEALGQFKIPKIIIDVSIVEFFKGCSQMRGRLFIEDFVHI